MENIVDVWIDWNDKKIHSHDFCIAFEIFFRKEIKKRIKQKQTLKEKIERQLIRE